MFKKSLAVILTATLLISLFGTNIVCAYAEDIEKNERGNTIEYNDVTINVNEGTVEQNHGKINDNIGTVEHNVSEVITNCEYGYVSINDGAIASNDTNGYVRLNNGTISANYGEVEVNTGTAGRNSMVNYNVSGQVTNGEEGVVENNFGGVVNDGVITNNFKAAGAGTSANITNQYYLLSVAGDAQTLNFAKDTGCDNKTLVTVSASYVPNYSLPAEYQGTYMYNDTGATAETTRYRVVVTSADSTKIISSLTASKSTDGTDLVTINKVEEGKYVLLLLGGNITLSAVLVDASSIIQPIVFNEVDNEYIYIAPVDNESSSEETILPSNVLADDESNAKVVSVAIDVNGNVIQAEVHTVKLDENEVQTISNEITNFVNTVKDIKIDAKDTKIVSTYSISAKKNSAMMISVPSQKFKADDVVYVLCRKKGSKEFTYVKAVVNADGTISFVVPYDDCLATVVKIDKAK